MTLIDYFVGLGLPMHSAVRAWDAGDATASSRKKFWAN